jgi:hypothetical protein
VDDRLSDAADETEAEGKRRTKERQKPNELPFTRKWELNYRHAQSGVVRRSKLDFGHGGPGNELSGVDPEGRLGGDTLKSLVEG